MHPVTVLILLPAQAISESTPVGWLAAARGIIAERHRLAFEALGAGDVRIVSGAPGGRPFGQRLRALVADVLATGRPGSTGLIVLGGGAMPMARSEDLEAFLAAARVGVGQALANSYYSADAIAVPDARMLLEVPDLPTDNALPRWLAERAGIPVADLRDRLRLALDLDSPLDVVLLGRDPGCPPALCPLADAIGAASPALTRAMAGVAATMDDRRAELLVAGRTSSRTLAWLERNAACRVRALVEERGLKASSTLAMGSRDTNLEPPGEPDHVAAAEPVALRPARSILGLLLDQRGPGALGETVAGLADAAIIDTRVLLAHRLGPDESGWPSLADRLASDLLRSDDVVDPWLQDLTGSAAEARIPILLGGHTLVGPGLPLVRGRGPAGGVR